MKGGTDMTNIIKMGTIPQKPAPWYENTTIHCDYCDTVFMIDQDDFTSGQWIERRERHPGGAHTVEGNCPVCEHSMMIDVRALLKITEHGTQTIPRPPMPEWQIGYDEELNRRSDHDAALMSRGYREGAAGDDTM